MGVGPRMKTGKITVTTAEASDGKNVDVGFIPSLVEIINADASTDDVMALKKIKDMPDLTSLQTFSANAGGAVISPLLTTTAGLSGFDENLLSQPETALTNTTLDIVAGAATVIATGGAFLTEIAVGNRIRVGSELLEVESITDNNNLTCTSDWGTTLGPDAAERVVDGALTSATGAKGFTIPAAFMDDGDVLYYVAQISQFNEVDPVPAI